MLDQVDVIDVLGQQLLGPSALSLLEVEVVIGQHGDHALLSGLGDVQRAGEAEDHGVDAHESRVVDHPDVSHLDCNPIVSRAESCKEPQDAKQNGIAD